MLNITKEGNLIRVEELSLGWIDNQTNIVYYDLENKKKKVNNDPWYDMHQSSIDWVNKYYVPRLEKQNG